MKISVISDTHDNIWKLEEAIPYLAQTDSVLHCGDLVAPFMIKRFSDGLGGTPLHIIWGNNDGDKRLISKIAQEARTIFTHGDFVELELGGKKIALNHYPEIGRALAESGKYDLICYGHDHTVNEEWVENTLLLNPGELMGMNGRSTFAIYDTESSNVEWIELS